MIKIEAIIERDNPRAKKPLHLQKHIFIIYSLRAVTVETASCTKMDANILLNLPKKAKAFLASKFKGHEIYQVNNEKKTPVGRSIEYILY